MTGSTKVEPPAVMLIEEPDDAPPLLEVEDPGFCIAFGELVPQPDTKRKVENANAPLSNDKASLVFIIWLA